MSSIKSSQESTPLESLEITKNSIGETISEQGILDIAIEKLKNHSTLIEEIKSRLNKLQWLSSSLQWVIKSALVKLLMNTPQDSSFSAAAQALGKK
jgi:enoyl-[acyl-carrier-protein] reductase (NADH)